MARRVPEWVVPVSAQSERANPQIAHIGRVGHHVSCGQGHGSTQPRCGVRRIDCTERAVMPRSVTTARTGCHGGLSELVPVDEVDAATVLSHTQREFPPDQVLAL
jgi:hypothetical protein